MSMRTSLLTIGFLIALSSRAICHESGSVEEFSVNGLKVILKSNPANDIISVQLYLRGGAMNLTESTQGIEPLTFRSAARGSGKYPKEKVDEILDRTAAEVNTESSLDNTSITLRCVKRYFDEVWDVFADAVMNPSLDPSEVELVRKNLLVGIRQRIDNPDDYLQEISVDLFYAGHPYELDPYGVESSVSNISVGQMRSHLKENLVTSKLLLVAVGNVSKDELRKKVESSFGRLPMGNYGSVFPPMVRHSSSNIKIVERELPTNYIVGYFSAPSLRDSDYYPLVIAMNILGTRVWEEVRTKRSLSYAPGVRLSSSYSNRAGIYVTAVNPDTTIKVMFDELKKLQTEPVTAKDLRDRITIYLSRYFRTNETNAAQGQFLAAFELAGLGWKASESYVENLRKVTADDVQRVARQYFHDLQFAVLGNPNFIDRKLFTSM